MKLKSYMRGLGLGLIVSSLVIMAGAEPALSDEEVRARAKQLGMIEGGAYLASGETDAQMESLPSHETVEKTGEAESETEETETKTGETKETESKTEETETKAEETEETEETETKTEETEETETKTSETEEAESKTEESSPLRECVTFQIHSGESSVRVSKRLAEAGLVDDANAFDQFLCQNGYDKKLRVGTYQIELDSGDEKIAQIITQGTE